MSKLTFFGVLAAATLATGAQAQSYSIAGDFGASVFSYGYGTGGGTFTAHSVRSACSPNLDCFSTPNQEGDILKNTGSTTAVLGNGEIVIPAGAVHWHPGNSGALSQIIRFTALTAGTYDLDGSFMRLNTTSSGDGVFGLIYVNNVQAFSTFLQSNSYGSSTAYSLSGIALAAGSTVDYVLNFNQDYRFDSSGITGQITRNDVVPGGVPEPATWLMMILGFGAIGATLRPRRSGASTRIRFAA